MITVVRLKPKDKRKNCLMRTYTSAHSRTKYTAGDEINPSAFRIVKSQEEIKELQRFPQFEILQLDSMDQLKEHVQQEMEERARVGLPAVRAPIIATPAKDRVRPKPQSKLPPAANGPASDSKTTNLGRKPGTDNGSTEQEKPAAQKPAVKKPDAELMTKNQLLAMAKKKKITVDPKLKKADIVAAIEAGIAKKKPARARAMRPASENE